MKNSLKFVFGILFAFIILFANVSASCSGSRNRYDPGVDDGVILIVVDDDHYSNAIENQDRYPTYDYRWGYSYRTSDEYQTQRIEMGRYIPDDYGYGNYNYNNRAFYQDRPTIKYVYSDYMRGYEKIECYNYQPRGKVFYTKC